jgi:predicted enzyme related to lactoylglutathione lyase
MVSRVMHFEIPVDDPARAARFYGDVFGWAVDKWGLVDYWTMTTGAEPGPGAEGALTPRSEAPEGVMVYVGVDDIGAAIAKVRAAGGETLTQSLPVPGMGWMARIRDSEGNIVGLFQEEPAAGPGAA